LFKLVKVQKNVLALFKLVKVQKNRNMRVKIADKKSNCPLMICKNIFNFERNKCYNSYINTPKMDDIMYFITYINELAASLLSH